MLDKFEVWQYRDDNNCWDYVRQFLSERAGVDEKEIPKFGLSPDDKQGMTSAYREVKRAYFESDAVNYAVACQYLGGALIHVGVVYDGMVWHTGRKHGTTKEKIKGFERKAKTRYWIHRSLCQK